MSNINTLLPPVTCQTQYKQRQMLALWNVPPTRLNLNSPYINTYDSFGNPTLTVSKAQLDMRRKVEILKYANTDSQSNATTKKQKWSRLNTAINRRASQYAIQSDTVPMCNNLTIPTSTTACDVPGPPMILQYDPSIPLYNFATNVDTFSFLPPSPIFTFKFYTKNELYFIDSYAISVVEDLSANAILEITQIMNNEVGVILMGTGLQVNSETFHLSVPVGIWTIGFITYMAKDHIRLGTTDIPGFDPNMSIHIDTYTLKVFYSDSLIYSQSGLANSLQDMSFNLLDLSIEQTNNFYAIQYVGNLELDLSLPVQPTFVYDVQIEYTYHYNQIQFVYDTGDFQSGVFTNLSTANLNTTFNCSLTSTPALNYMPSSFTRFAVPPSFGLPDGPFGLMS